MNPLKTYDYLTLARGRIFDWVRPLTPQQYTQPFPIGLGSLARVLTHTMTAEWYYVQRMQQKLVPPDEHWPIREEDPPPFAVLEAAWRDQASATRAALGAARDWTASIEYEVTDDEGRRMIVTASPGDIFTQLALHEVHHRSQVMNILRQLGVKLEDIDFNLMTYKRRPAGG